MRVNVIVRYSNCSVWATIRHLDLIHVDTNRGTLIATLLIEKSLSYCRFPHDVINELRTDFKINYLNFVPYEITIWRQSSVKRKIDLFVAVRNITCET